MYFKIKSCGMNSQITAFKSYCDIMTIEHTYMYIVGKYIFICTTFRKREKPRVCSEPFLSVLQAMKMLFIQ